MHTPTRIIIVACSLVFLFSDLGFADHGKWHGWKGNGEACKDADIQVIANGDDLSLLFTNVSLNMPQGQVGDGARQAVKNCAFRVNVTPPPGTYLAGFQQVFSGGIIKSKRSSAQLKIQYAMGSLRRSPNEIKWEQGREILPQDPLSVFLQEYDDVSDRPQCRETLNYQLVFRLSATRQTLQDFVLGGIDSLDARLRTRVSVRPQYKPCVPSPGNGGGGHDHDKDKDKDKDKDDDDDRHGGGGHGGGNGGGRDSASIGNEAWVASLYPQLLNRTVDPSGLAGWVAYLEKSKSKKLVVAGIAASPECYQVAGNNPTAWITFLYQRLLRRNPDPVGFQIWLQAMARGLARDKVVMGFVMSPEYKGI